MMETRHKLAWPAAEGAHSFLTFIFGSLGVNCVNMQPSYEQRVYVTAAIMTQPTQLSSAAKTWSLLHLKGSLSTYNMFMQLEG